MAVTLTAAELAVELRVAASAADAAALEPALSSLIARRLATARLQVEDEAPNAPDAIQNEATIRLAGYLFDVDPAGTRSVQSPMLHSGASALLARWREHGTGSESAAPSLPSAEVGPPGIDTPAVQALIDAKIAEHSSDPNIHHVPTVPTEGTADGVVTGGSITGSELTLTRSVGADVVIPGVPTDLEGGSGITTEAARALIKTFARAGNTTPPTPADLAANPQSGRVLGLGTQGGTLVTAWNQLSRGSPHLVLNRDPTPAEVAIGGLLAGGGVLLVRATDNHPTQLWVRTAPGFELALFHTFGDPLVRTDDDGNLPAAADYLGRLALAGSGLSVAIGEQGRDKAVGWADYGRTGSGIGNDELLCAGSFADPPTGNFVLNAWAWDRGSEVWIKNLVHNGASWVSSAGPPAYHHGDLFPTRADAERHVDAAGQVGRIYIYGHGSAQKPHVVTSYSAAAAPTSEWLPLGLTPGQVSAIVAAHNASTTAHADIRALAPAAVTAHNASGAAHADIRALVAALSAASGLVIAAYSATSTYSRGGANSIVTHSTGLFIYTDTAARNANHDPGTHPGYWYKLSAGVAYQVITSGSHRVAARTVVVNGDNDAVYLNLLKLVWVEAAPVGCLHSRGTASR